jgi:hypothetical protein
MKGISIPWLTALVALVCGVACRHVALPRQAMVSELVAAGDAGRAPHIDPQARAVVVACLSVDCPISNRVLPELTAIAMRWESQGVQVLHVYPNADEPDEAVVRHRREFQLPDVAWRDPGGLFVRRHGLATTPEVIAWAADGRLIYRGRIHDQFGGLGQGRPAPTRHDLSEALERFLTTGRAEAVVTKAIGCAIRSKS